MKRIRSGRPWLRPPLERAYTPFFVPRFAWRPLHERTMRGRHRSTIKVDRSIQSETSGHMRGVAVSRLAVAALSAVAAVVVAYAVRGHSVAAADAVPAAPCPLSPISITGTIPQ